MKSDARNFFNEGRSSISRAAPVAVAVSSLLARLRRHYALGAQDRELVAIPLHAASPAERAVRSAKQRVGLGFKISDGSLPCARGAKSKDACTGGDAVDAALALRAAGRGRRIIIAVIIVVWAVRPVPAVAPVMAMMDVVAIAVADPVVMMMAMAAPAVGICRRHMTGQEHGQGREHRERQFCKQLHLALHRKIPQQNVRPPPKSSIFRWTAPASVATSEVREKRAGDLAVATVSLSTLARSRRENSQKAVCKMPGFKPARPGEISIAMPDDTDAALYFIGRIRTPWIETSDCPRNSGARRDAVATIELSERYVQGLKDISLLSHLIVLYWLDRSRRDLIQQMPSHVLEARGVFALRSPVRPNPIGLSVVELVGVDGTNLKVRNIDCVDGTPLIDIKPYFASIDSFPDARRP